MKLTYFNIFTARRIEETNEGNTGEAEETPSRPEQTDINISGEDINTGVVNTKFMY